MVLNLERGNVLQKPSNFKKEMLFLKVYIDAAGKKSYHNYNCLYYNLL